jgi:hypothetical protein
MSINRADDEATARARSMSLNRDIDALAADLRDVTRRFGITRIERVSNYQSPPPHNPVYQSLMSPFRRPRGASATLSFRTRPYMRGTDPQVEVAGVTIRGNSRGLIYQRGHLLASTLGGSNSDPNNFAPMSAGTNTRTGGMQLREEALRRRIRADVYPPWIIQYSVRCNYDQENTPAQVQTWLQSTVNAQPGSVMRLFRLAADNANFTDAVLSEALGGVPLTVVAQNRAEIKRRLLYSFTPRSFTSMVSILQAPEQDPSQSRRELREDVLPASDEFPNHQ